MERAKIVIAERISDAGVALLEASERFEVIGAAGVSREELAERLREARGLIIRQSVRVDAGLLECATDLAAVAIAGASTDPVDVEAATRRGVAVFNTPDGPSTSIAEHAIALLCCLARHVARADRAVKAGRWDEAEVVGVELRGKTLGLIGLGRSGQEIARRALGLGMTVIAHDPYLPESRARELEVEPRELGEVLALADFLSLQAAETEGTRGLLDTQRLRQLKRGAAIVHCAGPSLIDLGALWEALETEHVAGAALDLLDPGDPLARRLAEREDVVATPRLAGLTREAQEEVGRGAAERLRDFLLEGSLAGAVNFPALPSDRRHEVTGLMALAERTGLLIGTITPGAPLRMEVRLVRPMPAAGREAVAAAAVRGVLAASHGDAVQLVAALGMARERGLEIADRALPNEPQPGALLELHLETDACRRTATAALHGSRPRLLALDDAPMDAELRGHLIFIRNRDVPGVIGRVGTALAEVGANIGSLHVGRPEVPSADEGPRLSLGLVATDQAVPPEALALLRGLPEMLEVRTVTLP